MKAFSRGGVCCIVVVRDSGGTMNRTHTVLLVIILVLTAASLAFQIYVYVNDPYRPKTPESTES